MPKEIRYFLVGVFLVVLLVGTVWVLQAMRPHVPSSLIDVERSIGPLDAPVQIIEYSDFQCPACQVANTTLHELLGEFYGKIRLVYQHFPLEGHRWSPLAHHAAECAAQQKKFWNYHDQLYLLQAEWSKSVDHPLEFFMGYAKEEGLDLDLFARCLADPKVDQKIQEERLAGTGLGVRFTPSFFVNGELVLGVQNLREKIKKVIGE